MNSTGPLSALAALAAASISHAAHAAGGCTPAWSDGVGNPGMSGGNVADLIPWDDGAGGGPRLYAIGSFPLAGGSAGTSQIAAWTGAGWAPLGSGLQGGFSNALAVFDCGLFAGGYFDGAGGVAGTAKLARWDGEAWSSVDADLAPFDDSVWALEAFDDGSGEALYVGGNYSDIGGTTVDYIARYDGASYSAVGGGTIGGGGIPLIVIEMETWNDGSGDALYIGGRFSEVAGVPASRIAKWDGVEWTGVGGGVAGTSNVSTAVYAIEPWNDGSGPSLFVAGQGIISAGGVAASRIARWDGESWHAVGGGLDGTVWDLEVFNDGSGEALYAVGLFAMAGGQPATRVAWDGATWEAVGGGANDSVFAALPFDDGSGPALYIGGSFTSVDGMSANRIARYDGCAIEPVVGDATGDGVVDVDDIVAVVLGWGPCPEACPGTEAACPADVAPPGGNGVIDVDDLVFVILNWTR